MISCMVCRSKIAALPLGHKKVNKHLPRVFNTHWLGDEVRDRFKDHGMDPDHSDKMRLVGMETGDQLNGDIYPRLPVT